MEITKQSIALGLDADVPSSIYLQLDADDDVQFSMVCLVLIGVVSCIFI